MHINRTATEYIHGKMTACRRSLLFTETSNSTGGRHDLPPKQTKEVIVQKITRQGRGRGGEGMSLYKQSIDYLTGVG